MDAPEALEIIKEAEMSEHRAHGWQRGLVIHEAFETVISLAESALNQPKISVK